MPGLLAIAPQLSEMRALTRKAEINSTARYATSTANGAALDSGVEHPQQIGRGSAPPIAERAVARSHTRPL